MKRKSLSIILVLAVLSLLSCKKESGPPVALTEPAQSITNTTAHLTGSVNPNGLSTSVRFEYGTTVTYGQSVTAIEVSLTGSSATKVNADLTGLISGEKYYFRICSENSKGIVYGEEQTFTTTVRDNDGNVYTPVKIGSQTWMKENLKATTYHDNTPINLVNNPASWYALSFASKAYCWPDEKASNKDVFGALYTWSAALNGSNGSNNKPSGIRGVCPDGWHVPNTAEWEELILFLGGGSYAGGKLKEIGTAHWLEPNSMATNESGFTALPAGMRSSTGSIVVPGQEGNWWSSSIGSDDEAFSVKLSYLWWTVTYKNVYSKDSGLSVRCVRD